MVINSKRLVGAVVRTKSGERLGKLTSVDLDADTGRLTTLHVTPYGAVASLLVGDLLIAWSSVYSMAEEEIIVQDAVVPLTVRRLAKSVLPSAAEPRAANFRDS